MDELTVSPAALQRAAATLGVSVEGLRDLLWPDGDALATIDLGGDTPGVAPIPAALHPAALPDRYADRGLLGRGGMGEVRRVHDRLLGRDVAMKVLQARFIGDPAMNQRFDEEARIGARLQHARAVPVHDRGTLADGRPFFTMREVAGRTFSDHLFDFHAHPGDASDARPLSDPIRILLEVCEVVAYAHSLGVVHRDLKPDNILVTPHGEVLVVDWGLARVHGGAGSVGPGPDASPPGAVAGTPTYMAPEQARGDDPQIGPRSDVYALGTILFEILTGRPAFHGHSATRILEQVRTSEAPGIAIDEPAPRGTPDPAPSVPLAPAVSARQAAPLLPLCRHAMAPAVADRLASAEALADALRAWLSGMERRRQAQEEVRQAAALEAQAAALQRQADGLRAAASARIGPTGPLDAAAWSTWEEADALEGTRAEMEARADAHLQTALVHAPDLPDAHAALAHHRHADLLGALAEGDVPAESELRARLRRHLQALPGAQRARLEETFERRLRDDGARRRARHGRLVARSAELERLRVALTANPRCVVLRGPAGVGKTRLLLELVHDAGETAAAVSWVDLGEVRTDAEAKRAIAAQLGLRGRAGQLADQIAQLLAKQPMVLVIDNADWPGAALAGWVTAWLAQAPTLRVAIGRRERLPGLAAEDLQLGPLPLLDALTLLQRRARGDTRTFRVALRDRDAAGDLLQRLGRNPLAIGLIASRLGLFSLRELSARFSRGAAGARAVWTVEQVVTWTLELLSTPAQRALAQATVFRGGFSLPAAEAVLTTADASGSLALVGVLSELHQHGLLLRMRAQDGTSRFQVPERVRPLAAARLSAREDPTLRDRHAAFFAGLAETHDPERAAHHDTSPIWMTLGEEFENLLLGTEHPDPDLQSRCALSALRVLDVRGPFDFAASLSGAILALPGLSAPVRSRIGLHHVRNLRRLGRRSEALAFLEDHLQTPSGPDGAPSDGAPPALLVEAGLLARAQADLPQAARHFERAFVQAETPGQRARAQRQLGLVLQAHGDHEAAGRVYQQLLDRHRAAGEHRSAAQALGNLALSQQARGRFAEARESYTQLLSFWQGSGEHQAALTTEINLGLLALEQGEIEEAEARLDAAIARAAALRDPRLEAIARGDRGLVDHAAGRLDASADRLLAAIAIADRVFVPAAGAFRVALARVRIEQGLLEDARALLEDAQPQVGAQSEEQAWLGAVQGALCLSAGRPEDARALIDHARSLTAALGFGPETRLRRYVAALHTRLDPPRPDPSTGAWDALEARRQQALIQYEGGDFQGALDALQALLAEAVQRAPRDLQMRIRGSLATIQAAAHRFEEAWENHEIVLRYYRGTGNERGAAIMLSNLGMLDSTLGDPARAVARLDESLALHRTLGHRIMVAGVLSNLAVCHFRTGDYGSAVRFFQETWTIYAAHGATQLAAVAQGNLGTAFAEQGAWAEAEAHLTAALDALGDHAPTARAVYQSAWAGVLACTGRIGEATVALDAVKDPPEGRLDGRFYYAMMAARVHTLAGRERDASDALERAHAVLREAKLPPKSAFHEMFQRIRIAFQGAAT